MRKFFKALSLDSELKQDETEVDISYLADE